MRISKLFLFLSIGFLLFVLIAGSALLFVDPAIFRGQLEARASAAFGRPFQIAGPIRLQRSLRPQVVLEDVTIGNPDWASEEHFAKVEKVSIQVGLFSLFRGYLRVFNVVFTGVNLFIEERPDGTNNYTFGDVHENSEPRHLPSIERLLVKDTTIIYHGSATNETSLYEIAEARLWNIPGEPERVEARGLARGVPYTILFVADADAELSNPWLVTLSIQGAGMSLTAEGQIPRKLEWDVFKCHIDLKGKETDELATLTGLELPNINAFELSASVSKNKEVYNLTELKGSIQGNRLWETFEIEKSNGSMKEGRFLELSMDARLNTVPVSLHFKGGPEKNNKSKPGDWPIQLKASFPGTVFTADGSVLSTEEGTQLQMATRIKGKQSDTLSSLLGMSLPSVESYALSGLLISGGGSQELQDLKIQMGSNYVTGYLHWEDKAPRPLLTVELSTHELKLNELLDTGPKVNSLSSSTTKQTDLLDRPITIDWLQDFDVKLDLHLQDGLDNPVPFEQLKATVIVKDGALNAHFQGAVAGAPMKSDLDVVEGENGLNVSLKTEIKNIDAEKILKQLDRTHLMTGSIDAVYLNGKSSGKTLSTLLERAEIDLQTRSANLNYTGDLPNREFIVTLNGLELVTRKDESLVGTLNGTYQNIPFQATISTVNIAEIPKIDTVLPIFLEVELADLQLKTEIAIPKPFEQNTLDLTHEIKGKEIRVLNSFLGIDLPFRGEFHSKGKFAANGNRFIFEENLRVGKTNLSANVTVLNASPRPKITGSLSTKELYLEDLKRFNMGEKKDDPVEATTRVIPEYTIPVEAFSLVDLDLDIEAKRILTAIGDLSDLVAKIKLQDGRFQSSLSITSFKGGKIRQEMDLNTAVTPPQNQIYLDVKKVNYGFLQQQMAHKGSIEGDVDISINLSGPGATRRNFLANVKGRVTVIGSPGTITGQSLDIWAADLLPKMLTTQWKSKPVTGMNCFVAHIQVEKGIAKVENILLDTQRVTIVGSGVLDLETEALDLFIAPRPKKASFVSLANPVTVTGTLSDPEVSVTRLPRRRWLSGLGIAGSLINPAFLILVLSDPGTRVKDPCSLIIEQAYKSNERNGRSLIPDSNRMRQ